MTQEEGRPRPGAPDQVGNHPTGQESTAPARHELPDGTLVGQIAAVMALSPDMFDRAAGEHLQEIDGYHKPDDDHTCDSGCATCSGCDFSWQVCWPCNEWMSALRLGVAWLLARESSGGLARTREQSRVRKQRQRDRERDMSRDESVTAVAPKQERSNGEANPSPNPSPNPSGNPSANPSELTETPASVGEFR